MNRRQKGALAWLKLVKHHGIAWLFGTPTTVLECLNISFFLIWCLALAGTGIEVLPMYDGFLRIKMVNIKPQATILFGIAAIANMAGAYLKTRGSVAIQAFALQLSGILWLALASNIAVNYPPLHIGALTYSVFGLFCMITGRYLSVLYHAQEWLDGTN